MAIDRLHFAYRVKPNYIDRTERYYLCRVYRTSDLALSTITNAKTVVPINLLTIADRIV